ncbi:MAG: type IV secretion system DNA-binding domain-containing protein [Candidatus Harrisonbacteria bacterium]|nr:type IV secretion system DNA-binding domain-containing protein [Candidatus Harrisonbacteria bacterium]
MEENKVRIIKLAPPPPELPTLGKVNPAAASFIGRTNYVIALEEKKYVFGIKRDDRRRHLYIVGKSGVGKSKLLELLVRQDIAFGHGLCFMDPHGDVIEEILKFVPEERMNDVVIIDPSDTNYPVSFNPLANVDPAFKHQLTQGMIEVMSALGARVQVYDACLVGLPARHHARHDFYAHGP